MPETRRLISEYFMAEGNATAMPQTDRLCRQRLRTRRPVLDVHRCGARSGLECLRELGGESAPRSLVLFSGLLRPAMPLLILSRRRDDSSRHRNLAFGGLCRIGAKKLAFERRAVKTPNDGLHLLRRGGFHEREAFGLLRLVIANYLDGIRYQVFRGEPSLDVVSGHPCREIS